MAKRKTRKYDKEFKLNAVNLYLNSGKEYIDISNELGIPSSTLVTWVKRHAESGSEAFPGKGNLKASDVEIMQLQRKLAIVEEERDILKKALGIFSSARK